jgi:flavodoxin I
VLEMKALVVYDSVYGNTEKIAQAVGEALNNGTRVVRVGEAAPTELATLDLLIIGSPTQGGRPTKPMQDFLSRIPESALKNVKVTSFDTRISTRLVGIFGYAAGRILEALKTRKGQIAAFPQGFFVQGTKGPLKEGELERAVSWAKGILEVEKL